MAGNLMSTVRAKMMLNDNFVFFATLAMNLEAIETRAVPTACTDGTYLWFNPDYMASLTPSEQLFLVAHETLHPALGHCWRIGHRDPLLANMAADYVINDILADVKDVKLPAGVLFDKTISRNAKGELRSFEQVYAVLLEKMEKQGGRPQAEKGQGGSKPGQQSKGQGDGSGAAKGALGPAAGTPQDGPQGPTPMPNCPTGDFIAAPNPEAGKRDDTTKSETDWQIAFEQAVKVAQAAGCLPGGMAGVAIQAREPKVDWVAELKEFMTRNLASDYSFARPNRRFLADGLYLPGVVKEGVGEIVLGVDTSGSTMSYQKLFASEFCGIINEARPEKIHVVYWDASVQATAEFTPDEFDMEYKPKGFGGTTPEVMFQWVEAQGLNPKALICLTDMEFYCDPKEPGYPVLWVAPEHCKQTAPFGRVIPIQKEG
jgi:predicted metal-dependent peptidase